MTNTNTIADRILDNLMGGDGCARSTRLGIKVVDLVNRISTSRTRDHLGNVYGWTFADGSEIECHGAGWDTPEGWASQD
jgi:hypothetical protein